VRGYDVMFFCVEGFDILIFWSGETKMVSKTEEDCHVD